jgi:hypothetical protein
VAISNSRLISADASGVTFTHKDYRIEGPERYTRAGPRESDNRLSLARLWERTSTDDQVDTQSL